MQIEELTKREYFAAVALQGLLTHYAINNETMCGADLIVPEFVPVEAVKLADKLIDLLNKKQPTP